MAARRSVRVLLVDDHPMWRETLKSLLMHKKAATQVLEAASGDEALELAAAKPPHVVVMDIDMPGMNGLDTTEALLAQCQDAKVLMLSGSADPQNVARAVHVGASGYMVKTSGSDEVVQAVLRVLDGELVFPKDVADIVRAQLRGMDVPAPDTAVVASPSLIGRQGLSQVLAEAGIEVLGSGDLHDLQDLLDAHKPAVAVVELVAGADASLMELIGRANGSVGILLVADDLDTGGMLDLLQEAHGGIGYVLAPRVQHADEFGAAARTVASGQSVIDPDVVGALMRRDEGGGPLAVLTPGERDVLALLAEGHSNQGIADALTLSRKTVEGRVGEIFSKLGLDQESDQHRRVVAALTYLKAR